MNFDTIDFGLPLYHEFEQWLSSKRPATRVGIKGKCSQCPLANFFHDKTGQVFIVDQWTIEQEDQFMAVRNLSPWMRRFVGEVDSIFTPSYIIAKDALEMLRSETVKGML